MAAFKQLAEVGPFAKREGLGVWELKSLGVWGLRFWVGLEGPLMASMCIPLDLLKGTFTEAASDLLTWGFAV